MRQWLLENISGHLEQALADEEWKREYHIAIFRIILCAIGAVVDSFVYFTHLGYAGKMTGRIIFFEWAIVIGSSGIAIFVHNTQYRPTFKYAITFIDVCIITALLHLVRSEYPLFGSNVVYMSAAIYTFFIFLAAIRLTMSSPIISTVWSLFGYLFIAYHWSDINAMSVFMLLFILVAGVFSAYLCYQFLSITGKLQQSEQLGRFLPRNVVDQIMSGQLQLSLGGRKQWVTVLFADIFDFTTKSEQITPEHMVQSLNDFFREMTEIIDKFQGTLDKFIGDAIMGIFGAPIMFEQGQDSKNAVLTAIEMQKAVDRLNQKGEANGLTPLKLGIGIHSGNAVVGTVGTERRMEYTVIGDTVNVAARLEALTRKVEPRILISYETYTYIKDEIPADYIDSFTLKGKTIPVNVYAVQYS